MIRDGEGGITGRHLVFALDGDAMMIARETRTAATGGRGATVAEKGREEEGRGVAGLPLPHRHAALPYQPSPISPHERRIFSPPSPCPLPTTYPCPLPSVMESRGWVGEMAKCDWAGNPSSPAGLGRSPPQTPPPP